MCREVSVSGSRSLYPGGRGDRSPQFLSVEGAAKMDMEKPK